MAGVEVEDLQFDPAGAPFSRRYGDVYASQRRRARPGTARVSGRQRSAVALGRARAVRDRRERIRTGDEFPRDLARVARRSSPAAPAAFRFGRASPSPCGQAGGVRPGAAGRARFRAGARVAAAVDRPAPARVRGRRRYADARLRRCANPGSGAGAGRGRVLSGRLRTGPQPRAVGSRTAEGAGAAGAARCDARQLDGRARGARRIDGRRLRGRAARGLRGQASHAGRAVCAAIQDPATRSCVALRGRARGDRDRSGAGRLRQRTGPGPPRVAGGRAGARRTCGQRRLGAAFGAAAPGAGGRRQPRCAPVARWLLFGRRQLDCLQANEPLLLASGVLQIAGDDLAEERWPQLLQQQRWPAGFVQRCSASESVRGPSDCRRGAADSGSPMAPWSPPLPGAAQCSPKSPAFAFAAATRLSGSHAKPAHG